MSQRNSLICSNNIFEATAGNLEQMKIKLCGKNLRVERQRKLPIYESQKRTYPKIEQTGKEYKATISGAEPALICALKHYQKSKAIKRESRKGKSEGKRDKKTLEIVRVTKGNRKNTYENSINQTN